MKLLSLASASYRGGATFSLINTLLGLKEQGVDIMVVTPENGYLCEILSENSIQYVISPVSLSIWPSLHSIGDLALFTPRLIRTIGRNLIGYFKLLSIAKKYKPDVIHTNVSVINIGYLVSKKLNIPHLWHIREYGDLDFDMRHLPNKRTFLNRLRQSYSIAITHGLKEYFGLSKKCRIIYNAIEDNSLIEKNYNIKKNHIIFVGRLSENKGTTLLVKVFIDFLKRNQNFKLRLVGEYSKDYGTFLKKLIEKNNASEYIELTGGRTDIFDMMNNSKAIIVPSRCEGFGRITAEAMFNNCLVIGRNTGGTKEQLDNGQKLVKEEIGLRFNSSNELLDRLFELDNMSDSSYIRMIKNAKKVAKSLYTIERNTMLTHEFLNDILKKESE